MSPFSVVSLLEGLPELRAPALGCLGGDPRHSPLSARPPSVRLGCLSSGCSGVRSYDQQGVPTASQTYVVPGQVSLAARGPQALRTVSPSSCELWEAPPAVGPG